MKIYLFPDNSAENSPLHDIVLQSAPGSPGAYPIIHSDHTNNDGECHFVAFFCKTVDSLRFLVRYIDSPLFD